MILIEIHTKQKYLFAEEVGFEPTIQLILYKDLADLRFKPLSHSSRLLI